MLDSNDLLQVEVYNEEDVIAYKGFYNRYIKRVIDFVLAFVFFVFLFPVYFIISLAVVLDTGFPIFYKAERGGYKGKTFRIFKYRSMVKDADKIGGGTTALNDSRITRVGNLLRKTKLDEIPQLINIMRGEMSFIGPRPELIKYTSQYEGAEKLILEVRPGITDYSSLEFINLDELVGTEENADEIYETKVLKVKNSLRIKYVATVSFKTDVEIFFKTVFSVIEKAFGFLFKNEHRGN